eukprot:9931185-Karenia_brevis.AAC.1
MRNTVKDSRSNAKVAEENMLRILKEAKSSLSSPRRQDAPPRDSVALPRKSRFDRYDGAQPRNDPGQASSASQPVAVAAVSAGA